MTPSCSTCRYVDVTFCDDDDNTPIMKCHRYPPVLLMVGDEVAQARPDADEWCGEYQQATP